jgi:hypothetical protein
MADINLGYTGDIPTSASVQDNINSALQYKSTHNAWETLIWFKSMVQNGGDWDYKQIGKVEGQPSPYENFGNFNYGAVGAALGIPDFILQSAAGGAQYTSQYKGVFEVWTFLDFSAGLLPDIPFGSFDDPKDQIWVNEGIYAANEAGYQSYTIENNYATELLDNFTDAIILAPITVTAQAPTWYEDLLTAGIELWEDVQGFGTELINSVEKFIGGLMDNAEDQLDQQQPDYGDLSFQSTTSNGKTVAQTTTATSNNTGYISTITLEGKTVIQRVSNTISGVEIKASFVADSTGELQLSSIDSINGEPPSDSYAALVALKEAGLTSDTLSNGTSDATLANSIGSAATAYDAASNSALVNLMDGFSDFRNDINNSDIGKAVNTYGPMIIDALSLVKAIQTGEPLPIVASGLRLANDLTNHSNTILNGSSSAASAVLSIMSLDAALKSGDGWAIATSSAYTIAFTASAYASFASSAGLAGAELAGNISAGMNQAIPYLGLAAAIAIGDEVGIAVAAISIAFPPLGLAYGIYSMIDSLFGGDEIPDPWGNGRYVWDGTGITYQSAGETGGNEAVSGVMQSVLSAMNSLIEQQRLTNPTSALGIIPNRMPSVAYDMSGYRYTDIDPLTGVELHPSLRFDTSGNPYNATAGSPESYQSIGEAIIRSALSRSAIAPMWEVNTAKMQTDAGDPKAGLTEEARAGRDGQLAGEITGDTQTFRPVALDLSGNGMIDTLSKAASGVSFDVDDSGYLKETAWVGGGDAFLTLDRDYNGETNSGREMFSNSTVALGRRGLAGMGYVNNLLENRRAA